MDQFGLEGVGNALHGSIAPASPFRDMEQKIPFLLVDFDTHYTVPAAPAGVMTQLSVRRFLPYGHA